jgi:hypothetical protein
MEAAGIEKDVGHPQTSCNTMLYARQTASYVVMTETSRKCSERAFGHSMVPIPGAIIGMLEGAVAHRDDEANRDRNQQKEYCRPCPMRVRAAVRLVYSERATVRTGLVRAGYRTSA